MLLRWFLVFLGLVVIAGCEPTGGDVDRQVAVAAARPLADYEQARKRFWSELYSGRVTSLYCAESFNSRERRGYNVEHVFPMSWVTSALQCGKRKQCRQRSDLFNEIEADLHNLYPARVDVNKDRSSYRFGKINGEKREFGRCDFEVDDRARVAEPTEAVRGDVARSMMYMAYQYRKYGVKLFDRQAKLMIQWHKADPPSEAERKRNNVIERIQGNRNPFIDRPDYADDVWRKRGFG